MDMIRLVKDGRINRSLLKDRFTIGFALDF